MELPEAGSIDVERLEVEPQQVESAEIDPISKGFIFEKLILTSLVILRNVGHAHYSKWVWITQEFYTLKSADCEWFNACRKLSMVESESKLQRKGSMRERRRLRRGRS